MNQTVPDFGYARQTSKIINRKDELEVLRNVMRPDDGKTRLLLVCGAGGAGKTRLLLEASHRAGNPNVYNAKHSPEKWDISDKIIVADLMDFANIRLHTYEDFVAQLYDAISYHPVVYFEEYEAASREYRNRRKSHVDYSAIKQSAEKVREAFWWEYQELAREYRIVWILDTAEQLRFTWPKWIQKHLKSDDFGFLTSTNLIQLLTKPTEQLSNTTIIIAGRPSAERFFEDLGKSPYLWCETPLEINYFKKEKHTRDYLTQLAEDFSDLSSENKEAQKFSERLRKIAKGEDKRIDPRVLHKYTQGQPIRLSLFVDVIMEGANEPKPLHDSWEVAKKKTDQELQDIQSKIESDFLDILFTRLGQLRSAVLLALVRARYGLSPEQLKMVLNTKRETEVDEIFDEQDMWAFPHMSFIKPGVDGKWILQDEIYNLYDKKFPEKEDIEDERAERHALYEVVLDDLEHRLNKAKEQARKNYEEDKDSLLWGAPAQALDSTFRYIDDDEEEERATLSEHIFELELEHLHYLLRYDFNKGLRETFEMKSLLGRSGNIEQATLARVELWKFIYYEEQEEHWREFVDLSKMPQALNSWDEIDAFVQAGEVGDIASALFFQGKYKRVIKFVDDVNKVITAGTIPDKRIVAWLNNTALRAERNHWKAFAEVYLGGKNDIAKLEKLEKLLKNGKENNGKQNPRLPQYDFLTWRLDDVRGNIYNTLGYAHTTRGEYSKASNAYKCALRIWRQAKNQVVEAITRNNLARVLSEMGLITRAERICRDAFELKEKFLFEEQIAYSHNTFALIYNNGLQPENAWVEAANGIAYFRKLQNDRGLGLAYFHLAEALRRLALSPKAKQDDPRKLLAVSEQAIKRSAEIFSALSEPLRLIEIDIEMGSLYRDYIKYYTRQQKFASELSDKINYEQERVVKYRKKALKTFNRAIKRAKEYKYVHLELDAEINVAWTYYYAGENETAMKKANECKEFVEKNKPESLLKENCPPPNPDPRNMKDKIEPNWFMRLAKLHGLKAQIEMNNLWEKIENCKNDGCKISEDDCKDAATNYVLALGYNQLYSPRSPFIPIIFGELYEALRKFNLEELKHFNKAQKEAEEKYRTNNIKYVNLINVSSFMEDSFGI